jgi:hypothetical protein
MYTVFYCVINPLFQLLHLTGFTLRLHDVRQVRAQIPKFFSANPGSRAFGNDFDAATLRRCRCGDLTAHKILSAGSGTEFNPQDLLQRCDRATAVFGDD